MKLHAKEKFRKLVEHFRIRSEFDEVLDGEEEMRSDCRREALLSYLDELEHYVLVEKVETTKFFTRSQYIAHKAAKENWSKIKAKLRWDKDVKNTSLKKKTSASGKVLVPVMMPLAIVRRKGTKRANVQLGTDTVDQSDDDEETLAKRRRGCLIVTVEPSDLQQGPLAAGVDEVMDAFMGVGQDDTDEEEQDDEENNGDAEGHESDDICNLVAIRRRCEETDSSDVVVIRRFINNLCSRALQKMTNKRLLPISC